MGLKSTIGAVAKVLPVIIAYAPALADLVRQVKEALKKPKAPVGQGDEPVPAQ
ncbi:MAG TPA: hypothetical protein VIA98_06765 [Allosphingosinicella sp.]|jgi:hypothetical protein